MTTRIIIIASALLVLGCTLLILFLVRLIKRLSFHPQEGKTVKPPATVSFLAIFGAMILLIFSWIMFWSAGQLQHFKPYTPSNNICMIEVQQTGDPVKAMKFLFYPLCGDSLDTPTEFYLSGNTWYLKGQYIKTSGYLTRLLDWPYAYKVTDFHGDYKGRKPPGIDVPILNHQLIEGGEVDFGEYISAISFLKNAIEDRQDGILLPKESLFLQDSYSTMDTHKCEDFA